MPRPDPARSVAAAYDALAPWYARARRFRERGRLDAFLEGLPRGAAVLDAGCGSGVPVARHLVRRGLAVTGVDLSAGQLALAAERLPGLRTIRGDLRRVALPAAGFQAIVAWDVAFHVPRAGHAALFRRLARWLAPGGRLVLTLGGSAFEGWLPMGGRRLFFSGHAPRHALRLLRGAGLEVVSCDEDDASGRGHLVVLAVRPVARGVGPRPVGRRPGLRG